MKTIEKIEIIKKLKIYEEKFGFDEKLENAQNKIALADDEEMKQLFAQYILGADRKVLFAKRMTEADVIKKSEDEAAVEDFLGSASSEKSEEEKVIENFLGPLALGEMTADEEILDKPVFVDTLSVSITPQSKDKLAASLSQSSNGPKLTADEFESDDQYKIAPQSGESVAARQSSTTPPVSEPQVSEHEVARQASDLVDQVGGVGELKPSNETRVEEPRRQKVYSSESNVKKGSAFAAIIVASLLGLIGCAAFVGIYFLGFISGWVAFLTIILAGFGYRKVYGFLDKKAYVIITIITIIEMIVSLLACYGIGLMGILNTESLIEGVKGIFTVMLTDYPEMKTAFISDSITTVIFSIVGVVFYIANNRTSRKAN